MDKHLILIIDDEPKIGNSLAAILSREYSVLVASNGEDGLHLVRNNSISLVLLDLNMQKMPGADVLEKIRQIDRHLKVMIMTGYRDWEWMTKCTNLGIQGYIEKPFDPNELLERLRTLLGDFDCMLLQDLWGDKYKTKFAALSHTVKAALLYVRLNQHKNINREAVAAHLNISPEHLSRLFTQECDMQLMEYINHCKILKSKDYMGSASLYTIQKVASSVGFQDVNYFSRLFKKHTGMTPTQFRKQT